MNIQEMVGDLKDKGILGKNFLDYKPLSGGTVSTLGLLLYEDGTKQVVKANDPKIVEAEAQFLSFYEEIDFLPNLIYVEPSNRYLLYSFVEGTTESAGSQKGESLKILVKEVINKYKHVPANLGWGWADEPVESWDYFFMNKIDEAAITLQNVLEESDREIVLKLVNKTCCKVEQPYLIHGDCGIHNFIFSDAKLTGLIDPTPVYGEPIYDLIYAFCSSPNELTIETFLPAAELLVENKYRTDELFEKVVVGLYLRIATCLKHHPEDLNDYLHAWSYWKTLVKAGQ